MNKIIIQSEKFVLSVNIHKNKDYAVLKELLLKMKLLKC